MSPFWTIGQFESRFYPFHCSTVEGQWGMMWWPSPEIQNKFFNLPFIGENIVAFAPMDQMARLTFVVSLVIRPTKVVPSTNMTMQLVALVGTQTKTFLFISYILN